MKTKGLITALLLIISMGIYATNTDIQLTLPDITVTYGEEIVVPVTTTSLTGMNITAWQFNVIYDKSKYLLNQITTQNTLSANGMAILNQIDAGTAIAVIFTQPMAGSGVLIKLNFTCLTPGSSTLSLADVIFNSTTYPQTDTGSINTISAPVNGIISMPEITAERSETILIPVSVQNVAGMNCISYQFNLNYNSASITYTGYSTTGTLSSGWVITPYNNAGLLSLAGISSTPLTSDGILLYLQFQINSTTTQSSLLTLSNVVMNTINNITVNNGRVDLLELKNLALGTTDPLTHVVETNFPFSWTYYTNLSGTCQTILEIGTDNNWTTAEIYSSGWVNNMSNTSISNLADGQEFYVRACARVGTKMGTWKYMSFHTNMLPATPAITAPVSNQLVTLQNYNIIATNRTDTDGDALTWTCELSSGHGTQTFTSTTNTIAVTLYDNENYTAKVKISDGYEISSWSTTVSFRVNHTNDTPTVVSTFSNISFNEDTNYSGLALASHFTDLDLPFGDHLTYTCTQMTGATATIASNSLSITPNLNWNGTGQITIRATDDLGAYVTSPINVTINPVNDAPVVANPISNFNFNEDTTNNSINLTTVFSDVDNTTLTYTYSGNSHIGVGIASGIVTLTPQSNWNGAETITFRGTDAGALFASTSVTVTINSVNDAPRATNVSIAGTPRIGNILTGVYTFNDVDGTQGTSTFKWYRIIGANQTVIAGAVSLTYSITAADVGNYLKFEVIPKDNLGLAGTAVRSSSYGVIQPFLAPENLTAVQVSSYIDLNWSIQNNDTALVGFNIYRNSILLNPTPITALTYQDNSVNEGSNYQYTVKAVYVNPNGESAASNAVSVYVPFTFAPTPANFRIELSGGLPVLVWDAVAYASEYKIYASDDPELVFSSWTLVTTLPSTQSQYTVTIPVGLKFYKVTAIR